MERKRQSLDSSHDQDETGRRWDPSPRDFVAFLPWLCRQFQLEQDLVINKVFQHEYVSTLNLKKNQKGTNKSDIRLSVQNNGDHNDAKKSLSDAMQDYNQDDAVITLTAVYIGEKLLEIRFDKHNSSLPRLLLKLIALIVQFQRNLFKIAIQSHINMYILHELSKILSLSNITDICLDGTCVPQADYHILLESPSRLTYLSLSRCNVKDANVQMIASKLVYPQPASKTLAFLNLSSNNITDVGAKYVADVLRTNIHLKYLNLADNKVSDNGFLKILDVFTKFLITPEEKIEMREQRVKYFKEKIALTNQIMADLRSAEKDVKHRNIKSANSAKNAFDSELQKRAEILVHNVLGEFKHSFSPSNTDVSYGQLFCRGNNTLCYLNMAYNDLTYDSLTKLVEILEYQTYQNRKPKGLVAFSLEGNPLPLYCDEFSKIDNLLNELGDRNVRKPYAKKHPKYK